MKKRELQTTRHSAISVWYSAGLLLCGLFAWGCAAEDSSNAENTGGAGADNDAIASVDYDEQTVSGSDGLGAADDSCGTVRYTWDGTDVYSNGAAQGTGKCCGGCDGKYGYRYQCVELVNRYLMTKWNTPRIYGNARDLLKNAPKENFDIYENGSAVAPVPGDFIVFDKVNASYGHVALVTAVSRDLVTIIEQNVAGYLRTLPREGNRVSAGWSGWNVLGWGHVKSNTQVATTTVTPPAATSQSLAYAANAVVQSGTDFLFVRDANGSVREGLMVTSGTAVTVLEVLKSTNRVHLQYKNGAGSVIDGYVTNVPGWMSYTYAGQYANGSTSETVYDDSGAQVGSLDPRETATPLYRKNGMLHVVYATADGGANSKSGFVKYDGGFSKF